MGKRDGKGRFVKGAGRWKKGDPSPNPGGRPKGFAQLAKQLTNGGQTMIERAIAIMNNRRVNAMAQMRAIEYLTDRTEGKAAQRHLIGKLEDSKKLLDHIEAAARELFGDEGAKRLEENFRARLAADPELGEE